MSTFPSSACAIPVVRSPAGYIPPGRGVCEPAVRDQPIMQFKDLVPDQVRYKEWLAWVKPFEDRRRQG